MVIGNQQIATAFDQTHHRVMHIERNQAALSGPNFSRSSDTHAGKT